MTEHAFVSYGKTSAVHDAHKHIKDLAPLAGVTEPWAVAARKEEGGFIFWSVYLNYGECRRVAEQIAERMGIQAVRADTPKPCGIPELNDMVGCFGRDKYAPDAPSDNS